MNPSNLATSGTPIINFLNNAVRNRRSDINNGEGISPTISQQRIAEPHPGCPTHPAACNCLSTEAPDSATRYRKPQNILSLSTRITVARWMVDEVARSGSEKRLCSKTISHFPQFFKNTKEANYMRAIRLWREREKLLSEATKRGKRGDPRMQSVSTISSVGLKRVMTKARSGRGRKRASWVVAWQADLVEEFDRYNLVGRSQCGKLQISPEAQQKIERRVAFFLGKVARELSSGQLKQDWIENADETHFVINMDNGRTVGFRGDLEVRYADVTSGGQGMTMMVRITGGTRSELAKTPFTYTFMLVRVVQG